MLKKLSTLLNFNFMKSIFEQTTRPPDSLFFKKNDVNDVRLGEIVSSDPADYEKADVVIIGCPQDEGVRRNGGRLGAASAPDKIREQFYKLTTLGIDVKIFDLGNTKIEGSLEEIHDRQIAIVKQLLKDDKIIISLGGGNDVSYPDCRALSETVGRENVIALNIDAHFDVRADSPRNSGTPYRQLLEEKRVEPKHFYEIGWQEQLNSKVYFDYLKNLNTNLISLDNHRYEQNNWGKRIELQRTKHVFWGLDVDAVRMSDAPGVSAANPLGFSAREFCGFARLAGVLTNTRIVEFTEVNPNFDIDNRTTKLVATAMHKFCSSCSSFR